MRVAALSGWDSQTHWLLSNPFLSSFSLQSICSVFTFFVVFCDSTTSFIFFKSISTCLRCPPLSSSILPKGSHWLLSHGRSRKGRLLSDWERFYLSLSNQPSVALMHFHVLPLQAFESLLQLYEARATYEEFCIPMCMVPATISNNVPGTDLSIGADTALNAIVEVRQ